MSKPNHRQMNELRMRFGRMDKSGNWALSFTEMCAFLRAGNPGMSDRELQGLFRSIDTNRSGQVDFNEFVDYIFSDTHDEVEPLAQRAPASPLRGAPGPRGFATPEAGRRVPLATPEAGRPGSGRPGSGRPGSRGPAPTEGSSRPGSRGPPSELGRPGRSSGRGGGGAGLSGPVCDWCRRPLTHEVTSDSFQRDFDGTMVKTTHKRYVTDGTVSLRLPGLSETVTLHDDTGCKEEYIAANALRCVYCHDPISEKVIMMEDSQTGEVTYIHQACEDAYALARQRSAGGGGGRSSPDAGARIGRSSPGASSRADGANTRTRERAGVGSARGETAQRGSGGYRGGARGDDEEPYVDDGTRCYQCRQPFRHDHVSTSRTPGLGSRTTTTTVTDAKTVIQLPGCSESVTLHSDGDCMDRYVQENALRCDFCGGAIVDHLQKVQLPWSNHQATLHQHCEAGYAEENATRCVYCKKPIRERGVKIRTGQQVHYLHAHCESRF